jgi:hypothetical protein
MITLTILKNPFHTVDRETHQLEFIPGNTITDYIQPFSDGLDDYICGCNGIVVTANHVPNEGDYIAMTPVVGKGNILNTILSVALMVYAPTWGASLAGTTVAAPTFLSALYTAAIMFVGGSIINHIAPIAQADVPSSSTSNPTYGWGNLQSQTSQGGALPRTYGTMLTAGIELAKHISSDGDKQYLNILLTGGQGPVDSITDIQISGNPIANYHDVQIDTRLGTNDQTVIPNFNDTFIDKELNYELVHDAGYSTEITEGNILEGLEISITFPNGLFYVNDKGETDGAWVQLQAQFKKVGDSIWNDWPLPRETFGTLSCSRQINWPDYIANPQNYSLGDYPGGISSKQTTSMRRSFRLDGLPAGQYNVRMQCIRQDGYGNTRFTDKVYWTQISQIIPEDFCRPGKVLVGIKALATDQLNGGDLTVTWKQSVETVNVWNPSTLSYEQQSARNAAWVCYDMIHGCRELKNVNTGNMVYVVDNVPASRIDYQAFSSWASNCDTLGIQFENMFDSATDIWTALKPAESFGRGKVIMQGTRFSCIFDGPSMPVQLFTVGNIDQGKFNKEYLSLTDRANAIEITFVNKDKDYAKDAITVYGDDYNSSNIANNPTQITLDGCTSYQQAYQHGMYLLRVNQLLLRTVTWDADIDALACQIGDQVLVQHDVPQWGSGGRLMDATATTLTLDRTVTMVVGKIYSIIVRLGDDSLVTKTVVNIPGDSSVIMVTTQFSVIPNQCDIFTFGEVTKEAKPFIVIDIERKDDKSATLAGIEYVPAVYEESLDAPVIEYSVPVNLANNVQDLNVNQFTWMTTNGTVLSKLDFSYRLSRGDYADRFVIMLSQDEGTWTQVKDTLSFSDTINVQPYQTYYVKVLTVKGINVSTGTISDPITTGLNSIPPDVDSIQVVTLANNTKRFFWTYDYPTPNDIAGFVVRANHGTLPFWDNAIHLHTGVLTQQPFESAALLFGSWCVMIKAVDTAGNESENAVYCIVDLGPEVVDHLLFDTDYHARGWTGTKTDCFVDGSGNLSANLPGDPMFSTDLSVPMFPSLNAPMFGTNYGGISYQDTFTLPEAANMSIIIDCDGAPQIWYQSPFPSPMFTGMNYPMFTDLNALMFTPGAWIPYTSKVQLAAGTYNIKVTVPASTVLPQIRSLVVNVDTPTITEIINNISISASGTRLPIAKTYYSILTVNISIQSGSSAVGFLVVDKQNIIGSGPEIVLIDNTGEPTTGIIDAIIQGI